MRRNESENRRTEAGKALPDYHARFGEAETGSPDELRYHSRSGPPKPRDRKKGFKRGKGIFRSNPSLLMILIDIFVIVIVIVFLLPILRPASSEDDFFGFSFSLHGYLHRTTANVSMIIQAADPVAAAGKSATGDQAVFVLQLHVPGTDKAETLYFDPQQKTEDPFVLRAEFEIEEEIGDNGIRIRCDIFRGGNKATIEKRLME